MRHTVVTPLNPCDLWLDSTVKQHLASKGATLHLWSNSCTDWMCQYNIQLNLLLLLVPFDARGTRTEYWILTRFYCLGVVDQIGQAGLSLYKYWSINYLNLLLRPRHQRQRQHGRRRAQLKNHQPDLSWLYLIASTDTLMLYLDCSHLAGCSFGSPITWVNNRGYCFLM